MAAKKKEKATKSASNVVDLRPKKSAAAVASVVGPNTEESSFSKSNAVKSTWEELQALSDGIAGFIGQMASDINESVEMVKQVGPEHPAEFNAVVENKQRFRKVPWRL